jgi:hypothetical protein
MQIKAAIKGLMKKCAKPAATRVVAGCTVTAAPCPWAVSGTAMQVAVAWFQMTL